MTTDAAFMRQALALAEQAAGRAEVPVGAVITLNDTRIAGGHNQPIARHDASAHAEIITIRQAGRRLGNYRLAGATLYVTLEPCIMCAGAIIHARIERLVYGAADPKAGAAGSVFDVLRSGRLNHRPQVTAGILAGQCGDLLAAFFRQRR